MKLVSIIILIALGLSIMPLTSIQPYQDNDTLSILTLNVCKNSESGSLTSMDMPFISESLCSHTLSILIKFIEPSNTSVNLPLVATRLELPPKV
ncbi:MAG: hypothetical protein HY756_03620 [Nitrospirae bacterium]|nr:hypothetical protein [Nitrospirota bacterium]